MKIAILAPVAWRTPPVHYGPWEQMASNLTEGLVAAGQDVTLFATADSLTAGKLAAICEKGYATDPDADAKVTECMHISYLMEQARDFDIIHNHFDFLPLTWSRLVKTPMVTTIHGFSSEKILPVYQRYNDVCHYVAISHANRHPTLHYKATIYNGIHTADFPYLATPPDDYLLFYGRIHPHKGAWEAIQIALQTGRQLIMAGIIQDEAYYREKVQPYIDQEQIRFIGAVGGHQRSTLLGGASALLHPISFEEPFGLSVAEAMLCGTPVIAFNRGSMPELILDGQTGFLTHDVAEAAARVADIPLISRHACHVHAMANFSQEKMTQAYLYLYQQL
ncbi:glycosyltransferase family 4 protein [Chitinophaga nivalis]|uniref:Glycosyltransferase family 4 protein n=1 Tax=Chitinophaga nivalis TaxID=2991709 RepID=A0ABT3IPG2_9BACT|nr:glycosyltransferase family 4 protein [Chitinophaga nivalis]MCW3464690.1 glycosyltransferase family 4 protein [Chitinophaga nivalis]MCW3485619.1 glycosyltransferase family 4 protein [Chitinophaga nivalis]